MFFGLSKNLVNFFRNFEIPQIVTINIIPEESSSYGNDPPVRKFICNSVILALHSEKFKRIISAGTDEINIENFSTPGGVEIVRHCIEFMYGDRGAVTRTYDIIGVCKFADVWEIPSLWVAGLNQIKIDLSRAPCKLFEFHQLLSIVTERNLQHEELWREFDKTARENADSLIKHVIGLPVLQDIDDRICKGLIKNSKTAVCGQFITSLINESDDSREFVLQNVQLIPVATAFSDETEFLQFKSLLLPWERGQLASTTTEFYKHHQKSSLIAEGEDKPLSYSMLQTEEMMTSNLHLGSSDNTNKASSITKFNNIDVISSRLSTNTAKDVNEHIELPSREAIKMENLRLKFFSHSRSALSLLKIPLSQYPTLVKGFPLYTGLDVIAHFISESDYLNSRNLMNLLAQFFEDPLIPDILLEDIKTIALLKCSRQGRIPTLKHDLQGLTASDRIETFTMTKEFLNIEELCTQLTQEKNINMRLEEGVPCPIINCDSEGGSHVLHGFYLDFSSESCVNFVSSEDNHRASIIHCYMLGMSETGICFSYIPVLQLTIPQIIDRICSDHVASVRLIIIFSNMKDEELNISENAVVKGIQSLNTSDHLNNGYSEVPVREDKTKKTKTKKKKTETKKIKTKKTKKTKVNQAEPTTKDPDAGWINVALEQVASRGKNPLLMGKVGKELIDRASLYVGFELVAMNLSRTANSKTMKRLKSILQPYFDNPLLPKVMLKDLKDLSDLKDLNNLTGNAQRSETINEIIPSSLSIKSVRKRINVFSVYAINRNVDQFLSQMTKRKVINVHPYHPVLCSICCAGEHSHSITDINIDLSRESFVNFSSTDGEIHKDHIIHCYALGLNTKGEVHSYISIVQLTVAEIHSLLSKKGISCVKVVVVFSTDILNYLEIFKNVLALRFHHEESTSVIPDECCDKDTNGGECEVAENIDPRNWENEQLRITYLKSYSVPFAQLIDEIKNFSLYTRLEIVGLRLSSDEHEDKDIFAALVPFFTNPWIPVSILEDLKMIALKSTSTSQLIKTLSIPWVIGRLEVVAVTKAVTCANFCKVLQSKKQIKLCSAPFKELLIDMSADSMVEFSCIPSFYRDHIMHCYVMQLAEDGSVLRYISILLLKISEILDILSPKEGPHAGSVKVVVLLSKSIRVNDDVLKNVLVSRIRYNNFRISKFHVSQPCASNDQSSSSILKISRSDKGVINDDDDGDAIIEVTTSGSQVSEITSNKEDVVKKRNLTVGEAQRTRLLIACLCSVKDYPQKIKELGLHLYSGLEAIAHLVSKRNLADKNLLLLLQPYFKDLSVSVSILEDVRCIALKKRTQQDVQKNLRKLFYINMDGRVNTFSMKKYHYDLPEFFRQLSIDKRISMKLDYSVLCQICGDQVTMGSAKNKETTNQMKPHILQGLEIDLSSDAKVDFIGDEEFHKDHLIHCYIVGLCADKSPISYVSILQLTVGEIREQLLKYPLYGVKVVAVFSKNVRGNSSIFNGILV